MWRRRRSAVRSSGAGEWGGRRQAGYLVASEKYLLWWSWGSSAPTREKVGIVLNCQQAPCVWCWCYWLEPQWAESPRDARECGLHTVGSYGLPLGSARKP